LAWRSRSFFQFKQLNYNEYHDFAFFIGAIFGLEPILRYGRVDIDDADVDGGEMDKWYAGVNWWANKRLKFSIGYGSIDLERFGTTGSTEQVLTRLQWIGTL
jgi:phosphate-selective porin